MTNQNSGCPFCSGSGGDLLFEDSICRVILVGGDEGAAFPGFCRVVCNRHVREMSDLPVAEQRHLFDIVMATEQALRHVQRPHKVNLASLGNLTPHVHWHIVPRWDDDSHFPLPVWSGAQRAGTVRPPVDRIALAHALDAALNKMEIAG